MNTNRSFGFGPMGGMPPAIKNIIFINAVIFLMQVLNQSLEQMIFRYFALIPSEIIYHFKVWQLVSYMFLHADFWHIFFNMFILWMFGSELEREWGTKEFLKYYFITGIGAGVFNLLLSSAPTIGASGAVYGIMLAYALRFPDRMVYIYFLFPVKVKYMMAFLVLVSFFSTFSSSGDGIAHAAHLGGIVVGFVYLKYWVLLYKIKQNIPNISFGKKDNPNMKYTKGGDNKTEYYRRIIDELLDKINRVGYLNLTDEEKKILEEGSKYLREHDAENFN
ncbi:MAG: rhomboid family intramembrane serine protease [Calditrichaceae bacterium]|nr:rhomboid family intramembrane serine protease [Calditrichaceae bacterium]HES59798.1 rhomboid family intramembrane serine protease [Caldithrix sp.]